MSRAAALRRLRWVVWFDRAVTPGGPERIQSRTKEGGKFLASDGLPFIALPDELVAVRAIAPGSTELGALRLFRLVDIDEWWLWTVFLKKA